MFKKIKMWFEKRKGEKKSSIENVDNQKFEIAFLLYPSRIEDIKQVADAGLNMPPKSTWVEPKLRSGLTIYSLEHD